MSNSEKPVLKSHRRPDVDNTVVAVGNMRFGDGSYPVVAGPIAVETEEQMINTAASLAESGASMLRAGTYRAENSPYTFKGLGQEGLWHLEKAGFESGLPTITEVIEPGHVELAADHADMLEIGPDNMQNFVLLRDVGKTLKPILLHRGPSATIDEWLMAAEYILAEGNRRVILCERGIRTFETATRNTLDISAVPVLKEQTHLPVVIDPSHATGHVSLVPSMCYASVAAGCDGLIVEVHPDPEKAASDGPQSLRPADFADMMLKLKLFADAADRDLPTVGGTL